MNHWFRVYDDLVDDPKVQRLPDALFRALINLWCLASANSGLLPSNEDMAFKLRMKPEALYKVLGALRTAGLITDDETGARPHNWEKRQFKSDVSNERVKRYRERRGNVTPTVTETGPDTDTDTELINGDSTKGKSNGHVTLHSFPPDGSIAYSPFAEIARKQGRGGDPDIFASAFRLFCFVHKISFNDPQIDAKFGTFCMKHKVQGLHS